MKITLNKTRDTNRLITLFLTAIFAIVSLGASAQPDELEIGWPREFDANENVKITLYQPQYEDYDGIVLSGRMAVSIKPGDGEMIFGALWFTAIMSTDMDERLVTFEKIEVQRLHFPELSEENSKKFIELLEKKVNGWEAEVSLDEMMEGLQELETEKEFAKGFHNDAPDIYYRESPTSLIYIDGDPILEDVKDQKLKYVVNTPFFIVYDPKKKEYYMKGGEFWWISDEVTRGWESSKNIPSKIVKLADDMILEEESVPDSAIIKLDTPPGIIVVTGPAELVLVDGDPDYQSVEGTSLLYVANSESDIIMDINSQKHFLLLAGRWYASKSLEDGDWEFVEPEKLPSEFNKIPKESDMGDVLASVPGTPEAQDALLEQSIPQTAEVDRKTAKVEVKYDGKPEFKKIDGTEVSYALNADKTVLLIKKKYYVVDDGVWFESAKSKGPWVVSTERPEEVDQIPASEPVYNVKYVYIYDSTPEVVYVGYLPGYTSSYVYGGVVVYGTGYYYNPWYRTVYYPRPATWGFGVHYNPWTGWGFSFGYSYGWFSVGFHHGHHGWWGAGGYRYGWRHGYGHGYGHGYWGGARRGYYAGRRAGYRAGYNAGHRSANRNMYANRSTGVRHTGSRNSSYNRAKAGQAGTRPSTGQAGKRPSTGQAGKRPSTGQAGKRPSTGQAGTRPSTGQATKQARPSSRPNNVYADPKGNVHRNNNGSWENRSNGQWNKSTPSTSNRQSSQSQQNLNRSSQSRQQGQTRSNNYNRQRSSGGGGRSGGGRRR